MGPAGARVSVAAVGRVELGVGSCNVVVGGGGCGSQIMGGVQRVIVTLPDMRSKVRILFWASSVSRFH